MSSRHRASREGAKRALPAGIGAILCVVATLAHADPYIIIGDTIPSPLTATPGDAVRGRALVADRQASLCLLCHKAPFATRSDSDLAPPLAGAGTRWSTAQLRLRIVDARKLNPDTIMPPYFVTDGLARVVPAYRDRTILSAQQIEDVIAFLATLRE